MKHPSFPPAWDQDPRYDGIAAANREMQAVFATGGPRGYNDPAFVHARECMEKAVKAFRKELVREFRKAQMRSFVEIVHRAIERIDAFVTGAPQPVYPPKPQ